MKYCESVSHTKQWKTRTVMVGKVAVGSDHPIRIQSMTTSDTKDVEATVNQIIRLSEVGCEIARVTVQGMKEALACEMIKNALVKKGYEIPLVADIHFYPPAAMQVIDFVDKVRINPGNFVDKRASFKILEYTDAQYQEELDKIHKKFGPLVEKCKRLKKSMRIGTNHGSLSDRIMNRFGDTPKGMVESAIEFANVCRSYDYHDLIFSMKASNPQVMIQAYRLLVARMIEKGWNYPLHLGVTEAGEGEDGRIKSAMGIGSLLLDGLGDTIRVSLTEDPWHEIDPCQRLVGVSETYLKKPPFFFEESTRKIDQISRREVVFPQHVAMHTGGTVLVSVDLNDLNVPAFETNIGCKPGPRLDQITADQLVVSNKNHPKLQKLQEIGVGLLQPMTLSEATLDRQKKPLHQAYGPDALMVSDEDISDLEKIKKIKPAMLIASFKENRVHRCRYLFDWLKSHDVKVPVILHLKYGCSKEDLVIQAAAESGFLLCDGLGDGLWLEGPYEMNFLRSLSFNLLQAARMRLIKTEFISCPSCGRTLFNLQEVTQRIRAKTAHLPGIKIAIMGCIVNGPGEMADADFGYVGSRPEKIDLYVGKTCVEKNIDFQEADERLIQLIKAHGKWIDPEVKTPAVSLP